MDAEDRESISRMPLQDAYRMLCAEAIDSPELQDVVRLARYGIHINFDINYLLDNLIVRKDKAGTVIIGNVAMSLSDYWTEIQDREALVKRNLMELGEGDIVMPRELEVTG